MLRHPFLLRFTAFSLAALAVPAIGLKALEQFSGSTAELLARVYYATSPVLDPLLKMAGILAPPPWLGSLYLLFLLVYSQALITMAEGTLARFRRNARLYLAWGPFRHRNIGTWLAALGLCVGGAAGISLAPAFAATDLSTILLACGRLAAFAGLTLGGILSVMLIAQQSLLARKSAAERASLKKTSPAIYVAFVAELVQFIGQEQRLPHPSELELTLSQLQEMAAVTHEHLFDHAALAPLCQQGLTAFADGALETMPDLHAALRLYYRPDPGALFDVAAELEKRIASAETAETEPAAALDLLPLPPAKGPDGVLT